MSQLSDEIGCETRVLTLTCACIPLIGISDGACTLNVLSMICSIPLCPDFDSKSFSTGQNVVRKFSQFAKPTSEGDSESSCKYAISNENAKTAKASAYKTWSLIISIAIAILWYTNNVFNTLKRPDKAIATKHLNLRLISLSGCATIQSA